jgi:hypothetical protein
VVLVHGNNYYQLHTNRVGLVVVANELFACVFLFRHFRKENRCCYQDHFLPLFAPPVHFFSGFDHSRCSTVRLPLTGG